MPKRPKRKELQRAPQAEANGDALSGRSAELTIAEPVRPRPISLTLWRKNLRQLRKDFLSARNQYGWLRCPLFQDSQSRRDDHTPPLEVDVKCTSSHTALYHDIRWYSTPDGKPIYLKHPIVDVEGKPIVDVQGRAIKCDLPATRTWTYFGSTAGAECFVELAERAGRALRASPKPTIAWIPHETLRTRSDDSRWVWSVFDLAWQGWHPSLRAERWTWLPPPTPMPDFASVTYVPYDLHRLRALRKGLHRADPGFPDEWTEHLPGYFISELPDLFQASADLIDVLLDLAAQADNDEQRGQLGWQAGHTAASTPAESVQQEAGRASPTSRTKRGRKPSADPKEDERIALAWETGEYRTFAALDRELHRPEGTARRAVDRRRHRQRR